MAVFHDGESGRPLGAAAGVGNEIDASLGHRLTAEGHCALDVYSFLIDLSATTNHAKKHRTSQQHGWGFCVLGVHRLAI